MIRRALVGVKASTLEGARALVEKQLDLRLEEGEGIYNGGLYYSLPFPDASLKLRNNVDLDGGESPDDDLAEPEFPVYKFLLYLEPAQDLAARLKAIEGSAHFEILRLG